MKHLFIRTDAHGKLLLINGKVFRPSGNRTKYSEGQTIPYHGSPYPEMSLTLGNETWNEHGASLHGTVKRRPKGHVFAFNPEKL